MTRYRNGDFMPTTSQYALIRRTVREIWNEGRIELADELFASNYVNHGGLIPDLVSGPEAIKISVVLYRRAFPRLHVSVDELRTSDGIVTLCWTAWNSRPDDATQGNGVPAAPPGRLTGSTYIRCVDGKIAESWTTWNGESMRAVLDPHLAA
jgi:hypothetical protein